MPDYTYFYRCELAIGGHWPTWDLFISAYNESDRVQTVFNEVSARQKYWLIHSQYGYEDDDLHLPGAFQHSSPHESDFVHDFLNVHLNIQDLVQKRICIDATGILRPHLMFLLRMLQWKGLKSIDVIYSEPEQYIRKDLTKFSDTKIEEVRQVTGFEGKTSSSDNQDILIIGAGYENHLIAEVAEDKDEAKKIVILGLPSLQADMYQQNAWQTWQAADSLGGALDEKHFAPASDPFATAAVLSDIVRAKRTELQLGTCTYRHWRRRRRQLALHFFS